MHHALYIEEILLKIFSYCYTLTRHSPLQTSGRWELQYANAHLTALARTCRTFKGPALDMIWAQLKDLTPLVLCLPETLWVVSEGVYSLNKPLEQNEWNVILGYTQRVRELPCLRNSFGLAGDCINALSNPPNSVQSIFPNLRVAGLCVPHPTISPFLRHLAHDSLTDILLYSIENIGVSVGVFGEECPHVTDFHVWQWGNANTISNLICHWKHLRSVKSYHVGLNADALLHLSCLHDLRYMSFKVHDVAVDQIYALQSPTSMLTFSALDSICLASDSLAQVWRLLLKFRFLAIHAISVDMLAHHPAPLDVMSFFAALQAACNDTLHELSLHAFHPQVQSRIATSQDGSTYYLTFDRLRPLTVFVNIKSIILDVPFGLDLGERELLRLASSWPNLERFEVGENCDWTLSSAITPGGFLQLLERCRLLRVLSFMFDTRGYTKIPQGHPWRGLTMPQDTIIHVLNSPIEEESIEALGIFFHVAPYPSFDLTTHWNNPYFRGRERPLELCDLYYSRWVKARSRARDMWKERRHLRHSVEHQRSCCHS